MEFFGKLDYSVWTGCCIINGLKMIYHKKEYTPSELLTEGVYLIHIISNSDCNFVRYDFMDNHGQLWSLGRWHPHGSPGNVLTLVNPLRCEVCPEESIHKLKNGFFSSQSGVSVQSLFIEHCQMTQTILELKKTKEDIKMLKAELQLLKFAEPVKSVDLLSFSSPTLTIHEDLLSFSSPTLTIHEVPPPCKGYFEWYIEANIWYNNGIPSFIPEPILKEYLPWMEGHISYSLATILFQIRYDEKPESIKCYDLLPYIRPYSEIISELSLCKEDTWSEEEHIDFINAMTYFAESGECGLHMEIRFEFEPVLPIPADYPWNGSKSSIPCMNRRWKKRS
jgi:hypothetical protein